MHYRDRQQRRRSFDEAGHAHELTFSCYRRYRFLSAERVCDWLAMAICQSRERTGFELWGYVFMPEHVHLLVKPRSPDQRISTILKDIKQPVGWQAFQHLEACNSPWQIRLTRIRNGRSERLFWQPGGGYDRNLIEPGTLPAMLTYIHENPVRRGLVALATDWRWSSAGWMAGMPRNDLRPDPIPPEWC